MPAALRQTLSTADLPPAKRVDRWNDFGSETLGGMSVEPQDSSGFLATITRVPLGDLGFAWMTTTAARARGSGQSVGSWAAPRRDAFLLSVQNQGRSHSLHMGRDCMIEPGDLILRDCSRPWVSETDGLMSNIVVKLPADMLLRRIGDPSALAGRALSGCRGYAALASSVLLSIKRTLAEEPQDAWGDTVAEVILDVLEMAYRSAAFEDRFGDVKVAQRREACRFVERHLSDPELSVTGIARELGVSIRYVQRLFLEAGTTPRQYVLDKRLDAAARQLRTGQRGKQPSVTGVAYAVGFNDLSYFSRAFAKKYGVSPRDYRRGDKT